MDTLSSLHEDDEASKPELSPVAKQEESSTTTSTNVSKFKRSGLDLESHIKKIISQNEAIIDPLWNKKYSNNSTSSTRHHSTSSLPSRHGTSSIGTSTSTVPTATVTNAGQFLPGANNSSSNNHPIDFSFNPPTQRLQLISNQSNYHPNYHPPTVPSINVGDVNLLQSSLEQSDIDSFIRRRYSDISFGSERRASIGSRLQSALMSGKNNRSSHTTVPSHHRPNPSTMVPNRSPTRKLAMSGNPYESVIKSGAIGSNPSNHHGSNHSNNNNNNNNLIQSQSVEVPSLVRDLLTSKVPSIMKVSNSSPGKSSSFSSSSSSSSASHPENPERSVIKDLLLKARESSSCSSSKNVSVVSVPGNHNHGTIGGAGAVEGRKRSSPPTGQEYPISMMNGSPPMSMTGLSGHQENSSEPMSLLYYVCTICQIAFRNKENLSVHQSHYCKGSPFVSVTAPVNGGHSSVTGVPICDNDTFTTIQNTGRSNSFKSDRKSSNCSKSTIGSINGGQRSSSGASNTIFGSSNSSDHGTIVTVINDHVQRKISVMEMSPSVLHRRLTEGRSSSLASTSSSSSSLIPTTSTTAPSLFVPCLGTADNKKLTSNSTSVSNSCSTSTISTVDVSNAMIVDQQMLFNNQRGLQGQQSSNNHGSSLSVSQLGHGPLSTGTNNEPPSLGMILKSTLEGAGANKKRKISEPVFRTLYPPPTNNCLPTIIEPTGNYSKVQKSSETDFLIQSNHLQRAFSLGSRPLCNQIRKVSREWNEMMDVDEENESLMRQVVQKSHLNVSNCGHDTSRTIGQEDSDSEEEELVVDDNCDSINNADKPDGHEGTVSSPPTICDGNDDGQGQKEKKKKNEREEEEEREKVEEEIGSRTDCIEVLPEYLPYISARPSTQITIEGPFLFPVLERILTNTSNNNSSTLSSSFSFQMKKEPEFKLKEKNHEKRMKDTWWLSNSEIRSLPLNAEESKTDSSAQNQASEKDITIDGEKESVMNKDSLMDSESTIAANCCFTTITGGGYTIGEKGKGERVKGKEKERREEKLCPSPNGVNETVSPSPLSFSPLTDDGKKYATVNSSSSQKPSTGSILETTEWMKEKEEGKEKEERIEKKKVMQVPSITLEDYDRENEEKERRKEKEKENDKKKNCSTVDEEDKDEGGKRSDEEGEKTLVGGGERESERMEIDEGNENEMEGQIEEENRKVVLDSGDSGIESNGIPMTQSSGNCYTIADGNNNDKGMNCLNGQQGEKKKEGKEKEEEAGVMNSPCIKRTFEEKSSTSCVPFCIQVDAIEVLNCNHSSTLTSHSCHGLTIEGQRNRKDINKCSNEEEENEKKEEGSYVSMDCTTSADVNSRKEKREEGGKKEEEEEKSSEEPEGGEEKLLKKEEREKKQKERVITPLIIAQEGNHHQSTSNSSNRHLVSSLTRPTNLPLPSPYQSDQSPSSSQVRRRRRFSTSALITSTIVSPETPRPKRPFSQQYLNGHAYTTLGLKVSTRSTYCCIFRPQPMIVSQETDPNLSMYSNWQISPPVTSGTSSSTENTFLDTFQPKSLLDSYNSNHNNCEHSSIGHYTPNYKLGPGCGSGNHCGMYQSESNPIMAAMISTDSKYWTNKQQQLRSVLSSGNEDSSMARMRKVSQERMTTGIDPYQSSSIQINPNNCTHPNCNCTPVQSYQSIPSYCSDTGHTSSGHSSTSGQSSEQPKRVKIFEGGFKSNEDYTYVRGRGRGKYVCEECGIRCKKPSMLKKHIRTHTDLRPYSCRHCAFAFKTKGNLTKHMKSKAHSKKCIEMGIIPVPTFIDETQIDAIALAKQEALERSFSGGHSLLSEDDEEEEMDEDDGEDEDEDDYFEDGSDDEGVPIPLTHPLFHSPSSSSGSTYGGHGSGGGGNYGSSGGYSGTYGGSNYGYQTPEKQTRKISMETLSPNYGQGLLHSPTFGSPTLSTGGENRSIRRVSMTSLGMMTKSNVSKVSSSSSSNIIGHQSPFKDEEKKGERKEEGEKEEKKEEEEGEIEERMVLAQSLLSLSGSWTESNNTSAGSKHSKVNNPSSQQQLSPNNSSLSLYPTSALLCAGHAPAPGDSINNKKKKKKTSGTSTLGVGQSPCSIMSKDDGNTFSGGVRKNEEDAETLEKEGKKKEEEEEREKSPTISKSGESIIPIRKISILESTLNNWNPYNLPSASDTTSSLGTSSRPRSYSFNDRRILHRKSPFLVPSSPSVQGHTTAVPRTSPPVTVNPSVSGKEQQLPVSIVTSIPTVSKGAEEESVTMNQSMEEEEEGEESSTTPPTTPLLLIQSRPNSSDCETRNSGNSPTVNVSRTRSPSEDNTESMDTTSVNPSRTIVVGGQSIAVVQGHPITGDCINSNSNNRSPRNNNRKISARTEVGMSLEKLTIKEGIPFDTMIDTMASDTNQNRGIKSLNHRKIMQSKTSDTNERLSLGKLIAKTGDDSAVESEGDPSSPELLLMTKIDTKMASRKNSSVLVLNCNNNSNRRISTGQQQQQQQQQRSIFPWSSGKRSLDTDVPIDLSKRVSSASSDNDSDDDGSIHPFGMFNPDGSFKFQNFPDGHNSDNGTIFPSRQDYIPIPLQSGSEEGEGKCICTTCGKTFPKPSQLRIHMNIHYIERQYKCDECGVSFRSAGHLSKHKRSNAHEEKKKMNATFGLPNPDNPRPFKCIDCKTSFRIHGHLAKHLRSKLHIMKLECLSKVPFGLYAEMERTNVNPNDIDTTDCDNCLLSLQQLSIKIFPNLPQTTITGGHCSSSSPSGNNSPTTPDGTPFVAVPRTNSMSSSSSLNSYDEGVGNSINGSQSLISPSINHGQSIKSGLIETVGPKRVKTESLDAMMMRERSMSFSGPISFDHPSYGGHGHLGNFMERRNTIVSSDYHRFVRPSFLPPQATFPFTPPMAPISMQASASVQQSAATATYTPSASTVAASFATRSNTCDICHQVFKSAKSLQVHLYTDHANESASDSESTANDSKKPLDTLHNCDVCTKKFGSVTDLQQHMLTHSSSIVKSRPYICSICDAGFATATQLTSHLPSHSVLQSVR